MTLKSRRDDMKIAQGKRGTSAALGCGPKMFLSLFSFRVWGALRGRPEKKKERLGGVAFVLPRATASAALPWAILRPPLRGSGKANQRSF